jgi:hypothetical protein
MDDREAPPPPKGGGALTCEIAGGTADPGASAAGNDPFCNGSRTIILDTLPTGVEALGIFADNHKRVLRSSIRRLTPNLRGADIGVEIKLTA